MPVSNEATERVIKRTSDYKDFGARSETDFQATLTMVGAAISQIPVRNTKASLINAYGQAE